MANTLTFANQTITDAHIFGGVSFLVDLNAGDEFSIGNTASACVSFVTDMQVPLYSKDSTNGVFTWEQGEVTRGTFYVTEVTKSAGMYTVTAYDAMYLTEKNISVLSLTLPISVSNCASAIATYIGCTVSGTIKNGSLTATALDEEMTVRDLLGRVAEASGCSVKIDGDDHLCFMYYEDSEITVTSSEYINLEVADYTCAAIDNVTIINSEGEIQASAGSGTNTLYIGQNPFMESATNTNATNIYNAVKDFEYAPLTCSMFEENGIEVGTIATFGTTPTLVMHLEAGEDGTTVSSVGSDTRADYNKDILTVVNETAAIAVNAQTIAGQAAGILADMQDAATAAGTTLEGIYADAEAAQTTLSGMQAAATAAGTTLNGIYADAESARSSATNASEYAARALGNLGTVQSVYETLAWITTHGTMTLTSDVALDPSHVYFVVDAQGDYVVGGTHYSVVTEPDVADISTYYELGIDESLNNYVATHLAVDSEGLWIIPDAGGNKVLIATGQGSTYISAGTYIVSGNNILAMFTANGIQVGQNEDMHLTIKQNLLSFSGQNDYDGENDNPFKTEVRDDAGVKSKFDDLGRAGGDAWESVLSYKPTIGTKILVNTFGTSLWFTSGQAETIAPISYDGDRTFTKAQETQLKTTRWSAYYLLLAPDADIMVGTRTLTNGSMILADNYPRYTIGQSLISYEQNSFTTGRYNSLVIDGLFVVGNGENFWKRSNAFVVTKNGNVQMALDTTATSGDDKDIYDALVALGWDSDVIV